MSKWVSVTCTTTMLLLLLGAKPQVDVFSKYKTVEAYELLPGILIMPRYSDDGQVCEIGVERRHYSPEVIRNEDKFSRREIDQVVDELVPTDVRGPSPKNFVDRGLVMEEGNGVIEVVNYENVTLHIYGDESAKCNQGNVAFKITWNNRKCL